MPFSRRDWLNSLMSRRSMTVSVSSGIDNFTGWMVAAIKKGYKPNTSYEHKGKVTRRSKKTNQFNDFEQHDYDFDAIEAMILANQKAVSGE